MAKPITPLRPHLFAGFYTWLVENDMNPHITVQTDFPGVMIPDAYYATEKLTLCIRPDAVVNYHQDDDGISFGCRFNAVARQVYVPMGSILSIFSKTHGSIMPFEPEPLYIQQYLSAKTPANTGIETPITPTTRVRGKHVLTLVK